MSDESEATQTHLPCHDCGSSDALASYDDGHTFCHSCNKRTEGGSTVLAPRSRKPPRDILLDLEIEGLDSRKITQETCEKFGYGKADTAHGRVQVAPYYAPGDRQNIRAQKTRGKGKRFSWLGDLKPLDVLPFGAQAWPETGRMIVVTEGEIDAMAMSQVQGNKYPTVSIPTGAGHKAVRKYMAARVEYFAGFQKVVIMFDMDEIGQEAAQVAAEVLGSRSRIAVLPLKDAGEMLKAGLVKELIDAMWKAKKHQPEGIVDLASLKDEVLKPIEFGLSYPWEELTKLTYGIRLGELIALGAGTGIGKTDFFTEIMQHLVTEHDEKVGIFALEQLPQETGIRLMGKMAKKPFHIPDGSWDEGDLAQAWNDNVTDGKVFLYDSYGINEWDTIAAKMRYLRDAEGVRYFFLDHLTALAAGHDDERKVLDSIMGELGSLVKEVPITIFFISHLATPEGKPHEEGGRVAIRHFRGSRAIGFWSSYMIGLERDQQSDSEAKRMTTTVRILKDRYTGRATGEKFWLGYDQKTGMLFSSVDPETKSESFGFDKEDGADDSSGGDY